MIGDNLQTDIKFAELNGIDSLLVLSGVTSEEQAGQIDGETEGKPTHVQPYLNFNSE